MSARLSANKYLDVAYVFIHEFTCQNFDHEEWAGGGGGGGGGVGCSWSLTKSMTEKKQSFRNLFRNLNTVNCNLDFYLSFSADCP